MHHGRIRFTRNAELLRRPGIKKGTIFADRARQDETETYSGIGAVSGI